LLVIDGISAYYGGVRALDKISLPQKEGEILALIGGNGAGKTTLLNLISGVIKPSHGTIGFKGEDIGSFSPERIVEHHHVPGFHFHRGASCLNRKWSTP
jgi:ABC-type branched-subunit amino acid transport system ATPase component